MLTVAAVPMAVGLAAALSCLALIQVLAFVLNILPVPGLDGFGVLEPFLSPQARLLAAKVAPWAPLVLLVVLLGLPGASAVLFGIGDVLFGLIGGNARLANAGYAQLLFWRCGPPPVRRVEAYPTACAARRERCRRADHRRDRVAVRRQRVHRPPAQVVRLVADHRLRAGRGVHEVAHVQVPRRDAERAGHRVDVDVQRLRRDLQAGDPGLLGGLAQRRGAQRGVARLAVAAELDPPADARVQGQQHVLARGVEHERRGRQVARARRSGRRRRRGGRRGRPAART